MAVCTQTSDAAPMTAEISFPKAKYSIGDCITPTDPNWSWFSETAMIEDIVYSKRSEAFVYWLFIPESSISKHGLFDIQSIDMMTSKLRSCPF